MRRALSINLPIAVITLAVITAGAVGAQRWLGPTCGRISFALREGEIDDAVALAGRCRGEEAVAALVTAGKYRDAWATAQELGVDNDAARLASVVAEGSSAPVAALRTETAQRFLTLAAEKRGPRVSSLISMLLHHRYPPDVRDLVGESLALDTNQGTFRRDFAPESVLMLEGTPSFSLRTAGALTAPTYSGGKGDGTIGLVAHAAVEALVRGDFAGNMTAQMAELNHRSIAPETSYPEYVASLTRSLQARTQVALGAAEAPLVYDHEELLARCRRGSDADEQFWRALYAGDRALKKCVRHRARLAPEWSLHALVWRAALERDLARATGAVSETQMWQRVIDRHLAAITSPDVALAVELWRVRDQLDVAMPPPESGYWLTVTYRGDRYLLFAYSEGTRTCARGGRIDATPTRAQVETATLRPSHTFHDLDALEGALSLLPGEIKSWRLPSYPSWLPDEAPR